MKKLLTVIAMATIVLMVFTACGAAPMPAPSVAVSGKNDSGGYQNAPTAAATAAPAAPAQNESGANIIDNSANAALTLQANTTLPVADQKLIRTGKIELQTKTYEVDFNRITTRITALGGYIEKSSESGTKPTIDNPSGRTAYVLARVPKASFDSFLSELGEIGEMISRNIDSQDISGAYSDTENKLKTQRIKLDALQKFLSSATKPQDILDFETQISETEQIIDELSGNLKRYDNQVDYSSIEITVHEVVEFKAVEQVKKDDFGTNISNSFNGGLDAIKVFFEAIGIALAASWPFLVLFGGITVLIIWLIVSSKKRREKRKALTTPNVEVKDNSKQI